MNENLNLYEILKDCPKGTKLWSSVWGDVFLDVVKDSDYKPISLTAPGCNYILLYSNGKMHNIKEAECVLFPSKYQRDWSKFKVPVKKFEVPAKRFNPEEFKPFDQILVRSTGGGAIWGPNLFEKIVKTPTGKYSVAVMCNVFTVEKCIPYNDETKSLIWTADDYPEYYKWWEE